MITLQVQIPECAFSWQSGSWPTDWPATIQQKWNAVLNRLPHRRCAAHAQPEDTAVINFDTVGAVNTWNQNAHDFSAQHIEELTSMLQLCQENGTRLLLISAPKTTLDIVSYGRILTTTPTSSSWQHSMGLPIMTLTLQSRSCLRTKSPTITRISPT